MNGDGTVMVLGAPRYTDYVATYQGVFKLVPNQWRFVGAARIQHRR